MATTNPIHKVILLLGAYVAALVVDGCQTCGRTTGYDFHSLDIYPYPYSHVVNDSLECCVDNVKLIRVDRKRDEKLGLALTFADKQTVSRLENPAAPFGALAPAYATQPCPTKGFVHWIAALDVVSSTDWDADHPAGVSLADLVEALISQYTDAGLKKPVTLLSETVFDEKLHLSMKSAEESVYGPIALKMRLFIPHPPGAGTHIFTLKVTKSNGERFEVDSIPIVWN